MTNYREILDFIEQSQFYKNYARKSSWISGSSTEVKPITYWVDVKEVYIQIDCHSCPQWRKRMLKKLVSQIKEKFGDVVEWWHLGKNDGSCPDEGVIKFK